MPPFCCSVFSFCWHSEHVGRRQRVFFFFFIGHMPLHNDLWMQALCRLILLSTHYVARPSVAIWLVVGGGDASCLTPALNHLSFRLLSQPSHSSFLSPPAPTPQLLPPIPVSSLLWLKASLRWCKSTKGLVTVGSECLRCPPKASKWTRPRNICALKIRSFSSLRIYIFAKGSTIQLVMFWREFRATELQNPTKTPGDASRFRLTTAISKTTSTVERCKVERTKGSKRQMSC